MAFPCQWPGCANRSETPAVDQTGAVYDTSQARVGGMESPQIELGADVLIDCVEGGASVSFMLLLTLKGAVAFW